MLSFQREPWARFWAEAQGLWLEHYEEVGAQDEELELDYDFYSALEAAGQLLVVTAREDGKLQGYVMMLVRKHPHYRKICGFEDAYFLRKSSRKGSAGMGLIQSAMIFAQALGAQKVFWHSKCSKDLSTIFTRLGFAHVDEVWSRGL